MELRMEEIRAPEMGIALLVARMDGRGIDFDVDFRFRDVGIIQLQIAANGTEFATDVGDHHVAHLEMNGRVGRVDRPGRNLGKWTDGGRHKAPSARSLTRFNGKEGRIAGFVGRKGHAPVLRTRYPPGPCR